MQDKELKHEFELERIILFSDAVFAIIITIMILDVKVPEGLGELTPDKVRHEFKGIISKFAGYMGSFFLVASFWIRHLKIFKGLKDYDIPLVVCNLFFLFVISMFPFAISVIASGLSFYSYWTVDIYLAITLTGIFAQSLIVAYIVKNKQKLCFNPEGVEEKTKWKVIRLNYILYPASIAAIIILNVLHVFPPIIMYVIAVYAIILRIANKKYYPAEPRGLIGLLRKKKNEAPIIESVEA